MPMTEIRYGAAKPVEGYGPDFFRVGGAVIKGAVLVTRDGAAAWGGCADLAPLLALAGKVDVLLVGTGAAMDYLPEAFVAAMTEAGLGAEPMASPAAARSYNLLLAEGRRVAAALLPVG